ncbi:MAG: type II toxin-antitoxin system VapC family toxin [Bryobacteraceae bacterium]|nr:type II toxin-antitoxin system VapC family toxin [Bryobacteraceae bacterium]
MVVDTSAILAVQFDEALSPWVVGRLRASETEPRMSVVNLTEAFILIRSRRLADYGELVADILRLVRVEPPTLAQAEVAALARLRYPLNLGDCFAYALAKETDEPLLTLDSDFRSTDIRVISPPSA